MWLDMRSDSIVYKHHGEERKKLGYAKLQRESPTFLMHFAWYSHTKCEFLMSRLSCSFNWKHLTLELFFDSVSSVILSSKRLLPTAQDTAKGSKVDPSPFEIILCFYKCSSFSVTIINWSNSPSHFFTMYTTWTSNWSLNFLKKN